MLRQKDENKIRTIAFKTMTSLLYVVFHNYLSEVRAIIGISYIRKTYEPAHEIMVLITQATSEGSGEPAHQRSLARAFAGCSHTWSTEAEPQHDKTNKVTVRPAKTQISMGIRPVWSVFTVRSMGS